jgi:hypothetical protein
MNTRTPRTPHYPITMTEPPHKRQVRSWTYFSNMTQNWSPTYTSIPPYYPHVHRSTGYTTLLSPRTSAIPPYYILPPKLTPYENRQTAQALGAFSIPHECKDEMMLGVSAIGRCCSQSHRDEHAKLFPLQGSPLTAPSAEGSICLLAAG